MKKCVGKLFLLTIAASALLQAQSDFVVSARALRYKPARVALKEFNQGMRSVRKGLPEEAAAHFTEAVRINPDYVDALQQLGIAQAAQGATEQSLDTFLKASALDPESGPLRFNVALTLARLHRMADAEPYARQAVQNAPWFVDGQYLLGITLVAQNKLTPEAAAALRRAAGQFAEARAALDWMESQQFARIARN
jgi:tetratricopeptide (TPR) repeat protein